METNYQELEEMRQQLNLLKDKLKSQQIVNDRMIRESMLSKMSFMKRYNIFSFTCLAVVIFLFLPIREKFDLSWLFYGFTVLFVTVCVVADFYINRYSNEEFLGGDLMVAADHMSRQRTMRKRLLMINTPVAMIWLGWFIYNVYQSKAADPEEIQGLVTGMLIGATVGAAIGLSFFRRMQRINADIAHQIQELTASV
jgi:ammonia channel protein AmtB